jgi:hypothetical protein
MTEEPMSSAVGGRKASLVLYLWRSLSWFKSFALQPLPRYRNVNKNGEQNAYQPKACISASCSAGRVLIPSCSAKGNIWTKVLNQSVSIFYCSRDGHVGIIYTSNLGRMSLAWASNNLPVFIHIPQASIPPVERSLLNERAASICPARPISA